MRAAVFYDVKDIRLEDVPEPQIGDEDVLVEVTACGICGSDLEYYMGRSPVGTADGKGPLILGSPVLQCGKYPKAPGVCNDFTQFYKYDGNGAWKLAGGFVGPPEGWVG